MSTFDQKLKLNNYNKENLLFTTKAINYIYQLSYESILFSALPSRSCSITDSLSASIDSSGRRLFLHFFHGLIPLLHQVRNRLFYE